MAAEDLAHAHRQWVKPEVNLGSVINFVALIGSAAGIWYSVASKADLALERVVNAHQRIEQVERRLDRESATAAVGQARIERALEQVNSKIDRLGERLAK